MILIYLICGGMDLKMNFSQKIQYPSPALNPRKGVTRWTIVFKIIFWFYLYCRNEVPLWTCLSFTQSLALDFSILLHSIVKSIYQVGTPTFFFFFFYNDSIYPSAHPFLRAPDETWIFFEMLTQSLSILIFIPSPK